MSGLPAYLDLASVARLEASVRRHVGVREGAQGWTDAQIVVALTMLNLAGGESVDDLRLLEKDEGLGRALLTAETHGMRRAQRNRWRKERSRTVPSPTAAFRYLNRFHDEAEEAGRRSRKAFIPAANDALIGTHKRQACYCYKRHEAYQPLTTYWHEADQLNGIRQEQSRLQVHHDKGAYAEPAAVRRGWGEVVGSRHGDGRWQLVQSGRDGDEPRVAWG